ncbi:MAG: ABC transporter ATP-binding protein [Nanoarchaeota archaeon]
MGAVLLKCRNLTTAFGKKVVLDNINLDVQQGEILGIIGASGSGKTTLLNTIIGFLKPEKGDILFRHSQFLPDGERQGYSSVFKQKELFKQVYGFAAQMPSFYKKLTVKENLQYFGRLYNLSEEAIVQNAETLLRLMELKTAENTLAGNLSGGMERRLDIGLSMMHDPSLLILDEPTADLDPVLRRNIWNLISTINKKGTTILLSSHYLEEMEHLCTRIAILKNAKIQEIGSPEELRQKYLKEEEVIIESYPGEYQRVIPKLRTKAIIKAEARGTELILKTTNTAKALSEILRIFEGTKENIIEVKVVKQTLEDMFINLDLFNNTAKNEQVAVEYPGEETTPEFEIAKKGKQP